MFDHPAEDQRNGRVTGHILKSQSVNADEWFDAPIGQSFVLEPLQRSCCSFCNQTRSAKRFIKRLNLLPTLRENTKRVRANKSQEALVTRERRKIVEQGFTPRVP